MNEKEYRELFEGFRDDVKVYFDKNKKKFNDIFYDQNLSEVERLKEYHKAKEELSSLCGWDSGLKFNQELFDNSIKYLVHILNV